MCVYYFLSSLGVLHLEEQHEQFEQLHPQELLPFFLLIIRKVITAIATNSVIIIVIISNGFILVILFLLFCSHSSVIVYEYECKY